MTDFGRTWFFFFWLLASSLVLWTAILEWGKQGRSGPWEIVVLLAICGVGWSAFRVLDQWSTQHEAARKREFQEWYEFESWKDWKGRHQREVALWSQRALPKEEAQLGYFTSTALIEALRRLRIAETEINEFRWRRAERVTEFSKLWHEASAWCFWLQARELEVREYDCAKCGHANWRRVRPLCDCTLAPPCDAVFFAGSQCDPCRVGRHPHARCDVCAADLSEQMQIDA